MDNGTNKKDLVYTTKKVPLLRMKAFGLAGA
jgi:hypothetical protein